MTDGRFKLRAEDLNWREVEGELLVLDRAAGRYLSMNPTATVLWPYLQVGATRAELTSALVARWPEAEPAAGSDVDAFLAWLDERQLLES